MFFSRRFFTTVIMITQISLSTFAGEAPLSQEGVVQESTPAQQKKAKKRKRIKIAVAVVVPAVAIVLGAIAIRGLQQRGVDLMSIVFEERLKAAKSKVDRKTLQRLRERWMI